MSTAKKLIETLQENLQTRMEDKELSPHELERKAGLKESAVRNILSGRSSNPGIESLTAIADMLDCSIDDLVGRTEARKLKSEQNSSHTKPKEIVTWNADLYQSCVKAVEDYLASKNLASNLNPSGEQILFFVKEVYLYTQKGQANKPDQKFIEWLIDNYC